MVALPTVQSISRAESVVGQTAQLYFYDWEANALTANGKTVASQLQAQAPAALRISQGTSFAAPGGPNAGSMRLYDAVKLASMQPKYVSPHNARLGPEYYLFGAPGSAACAAKARQQGTVPTAGRHCLLAGPDNEIYATSRHEAIENLASQLPSGCDPGRWSGIDRPAGHGRLAGRQRIRRPDATFASPQARFFVLRDHVALWGSDIANPLASTDRPAIPTSSSVSTTPAQAAVPGHDQSDRTSRQEVSTIDSDR